MHYWNKDNFEGLIDLANELRNTPELVGLAGYCKLREQGLRKQALHQLNEFLESVSSCDVDKSRSLVLTILTADSRTPKAHQFMTHPLLTGLIFPVLERWSTEEPSAVTPLRWLGLLRSDADALQTALSLDSTDVPVRRRLIDFALEPVDYATHHLSESVLLLSVEETLASIAAARKLITSAPDIDAFSYLSTEADEYEELVNDWVAYKKTPIGITFPEWCKAQGRSYSWPTIVYYDEPSQF